MTPIVAPDTTRNRPNAQAVTTEDQVIVAAEITTEGVDFEQLEPMVGAAERELEGAGVTERTRQNEPSGRPLRHSRGFAESEVHRSIRTSSRA